MQFAIKNVISFLVKAFLCMHLKSVIKNTHISSNFERKKFCLWSKLIYTCLLTYDFLTLNFRSQVFLQSCKKEEKRSKRIRTFLYELASLIIPNITR